jgi:hypothetical protein
LTVPPTTDVLLPSLIALIAFVIAARAYMAVTALRGIGRGLRARTVALEERTPPLITALTTTRAALAQVNGRAERGLWALPRLDATLDGAKVSLAERRQQIDTVREQQLVAADRLLRRAKNVAQVVMTALKLQRSILG